MSEGNFFVDVYLPVSLDDTYTYRVTPEQYNRLERGMRVAVEFGKHRLQTGIVYRKHRRAPQAFTPKPILQVIDSAPVINDTAWQLYEFMASYYLTPMGSVLRMALPVSFLLHGDHILTPRAGTGEEVPGLPPQWQEVWESIHRAGSIEVGKWLEQASGKTRMLKILHGLADRGLLDWHTRVTERYKPRMVHYIDLADEKAAEQLLSDDASRAVKQKELLLYFFQHYLPRRHPVPRKQLTARFSAAVLKALIDKGILVRISVPVDRQVFDDTTRRIPRLSAWQQAAYKRINTYLQNGKPALLHGITAAGKTEIYLKLIQNSLQQGKQVLYLLPEIALTTQMVSRIRERFGNAVAVYHSRYTPMERYEVWKNTLQGNERARLVLGTRSAVFLPFARLDLIIVDEEHDPSYKEQFHQPLYNARDMAAVLARISGAGLVLGSATPSVESYYNARTGKYALAELHRKFHEAPDPDIRILDLRQAYSEGRMKGSFARETLDALQQTVTGGMQAMVFINRRGYAPVVACKTCGHIEHCPHCSVPLTYHKHDRSLRCHYCGYRLPMQQRCRACGSTELDLLGRGTQRIADELKEIFPDFRIRRMDADTMRRKGALEEIIEGFRRREFDLLVGTQMITKGLDFGLLSLAVIVSADQLIARPDFRAHERAFQLLTQIAGRTGRRQKQGTVIIQAYETRHPVLEFVRQKDYPGFYEAEIRQRELFRYPPFYKMIRLELRARNPEILNKASEWLAKASRSKFERVLGPSEPGVFKIKGYYLKEILIKLDPAKPDRPQREWLRKLLYHFRAIPAFRSVKLTADVDP